MGKKYLQLGLPISPTCRNLDITLTHDLYQQHGAVKQNGKAPARKVKEKSINKRNKHAPCTCSCVCYPYFKRSANHDLYYHFRVRPTKFICTCLSEYWTFFANKIVKREKINVYVYLKEDILLILRNQPVKKAFTFGRK